MNFMLSLQASLSLSHSHTLSSQFKPPYAFRYLFFHLSDDFLSICLSSSLFTDKQTFSYIYQSLFLSLSYSIYFCLFLTMSVYFSLTLSESSVLFANCPPEPNLEDCLYVVLAVIKKRFKDY